MLDATSFGIGKFIIEPRIIHSDADLIGQGAPTSLGEFRAVSFDFLSVEN